MSLQTATLSNSDVRRHVFCAVAQQLAQVSILRRRRANVPRQSNDLARFIEYAAYLEADDDSALEMSDEEDQVDICGSVSPDFLLLDAISDSEDDPSSPTSITSSMAALSLSESPQLAFEMMIGEDEDITLRTPLPEFSEHESAIAFVDANAAIYPTSPMVVTSHASPLKTDSTETVSDNDVVIAASDTVDDKQIGMSSIFEPNVLIN